ncbi:hypothetical protein HGRIS_007219 [Hohenbuehelia grisea]|uniref:Fe2OG dioxygenase domain-containing protein n=1 Tax=Hohenbuehelia grisea TaxID=104357 RepID=A0ABR3JBF0_9AGAR
MANEDCPSATDGAIAIVDFAGFIDGSQRKAVADGMLASFKNTGFVYLLNYGLSQAEVDNMFDWSKKFFGLPEEAKQLAPHPPSGTHHRGYSAPGREKVYQLKDGEDEVGALQAAHRFTSDFKESFESGREGMPGMENIWLPESMLPGFREACLNFFSRCHQIQLTILRALATGLGLTEDYFTPYHLGPDNQLRLLHYPSVSAKSLHSGEATRISAHTDFCTMTLLFQDSVGGLEVEDPTCPGKFNPAPPVPGAVVVNAGDFLMRWSNDTIRSTVHRVRAPPSAAGSDGMIPPRYSIPYVRGLPLHGSTSGADISCILSSARQISIPSSNVFPAHGPKDVPSAMNLSLRVNML